MNVPEPGQSGKDNSWRKKSRRMEPIEAASRIRSYPLRCCLGEFGSVFFRLSPGSALIGETYVKQRLACVTTLDRHAVAPDYAFLIPLMMAFSGGRFGGRTPLDWCLQDDALCENSKVAARGIPSQGKSSLPTHFHQHQLPKLFLRRSAAQNVAKFLLTRFRSISCVNNFRRCPPPGKLPAAPQTPDIERLGWQVSHGCFMPRTSDPRFCTEWLRRCARAR